MGHVAQDSVVLDGFTFAERSILPSLPGGVVNEIKTKKERREL